MICQYGKHIRARRDDGGGGGHHQKAETHQHDAMANFAGADGLKWPLGQHDPRQAKKGAKMKMKKESATETNPMGMTKMCPSQQGESV